MNEEIRQNNLIVEHEIANLKEKIKILKKQLRCEFCGSELYHSKGLCRNCYARAKNHGSPEYVYPREVKSAEEVIGPWQIKLRNDVLNLYNNIRIRNNPIPESSQLYPAIIDDVPEDIIESVDYAIDSLSPKMQRVIQHRYADGLTLEKTGALMGVTRERIRQVQAKAFRMLLHPYRRKYLEFGLAKTREKEEKERAEREEQERLARESAERAETSFISVFGENRIEELNLSTRSFNILIRAGIRTMSDLAPYIRDSKLLELRNCGRRSESEIQKAFYLYRYGEVNNDRKAVS